MRSGVRSLLADRYEVDEVADGRDALELITSVGEVDVAIVELPAGADGGAQGLIGIAAIRALRKARPGLGIVAHAARPEHRAAGQAFEAGATAFVAKSSPCEALTAAVDAAAEAETFIDPAAENSNGACRLTPRQSEILQLYANGLSTLKVADRLGLSTETVRTHTKGVLSRLEAHDRTHAVAIGLRNSLID
jgi:DNA-binding NarL/FixJ family response regulator